MTGKKKDKLEKEEMYNGYVSGCDSIKFLYEIYDNKKRQRIYSRRQKIKQRILARQLKTDCIKTKGGRCQICRYNKHIEPLNFHHFNPESKKYGISQLITMAQSDSKLLNVVREEIEKCGLLCSNCHSELHAKLEKDKLEKDEIYKEYIATKRYQICLPKIVEQ